MVSMEMVDIDRNMVDIEMVDTHSFMVTLEFLKIVRQQI